MYRKASSSFHGFPELLEKLLKVTEKSFFKFESEIIIPRFWKRLTNILGNAMPSLSGRCLRASRKSLFKHLEEASSSFRVSKGTHIFLLKLSEIDGKINFQAHKGYSKFLAESFVKV